MTDVLMHELNTRVAVLEERAEQADQKIARLRLDIDSCNAAHLAANSDIKHRVDAVENIVDDLRLNTELTRRALLGMDRMESKLDAMAVKQDLVAEKLAVHDKDKALTKGWLAGALAVGACSWAVLALFKDQLLHLVTLLIA